MYLFAFALKVQIFHLYYNIIQTPVLSDINNDKCFFNLSKQ